MLCLLSLSIYFSLRILNSTLEVASFRGVLFRANRRRFLARFHPLPAIVVPQGVCRDRNIAET